MTIDTAKMRLEMRAAAATGNEIAGMLTPALDGLLDHIDAQTSEIARLRKALILYGIHKRGCCIGDTQTISRAPRCDCGYYEAIGAQENP